MRLFLVLALTVCALFAQQTDVAGDWTFKMETPNGDVDVAMNLKNEGGGVTGTLTVGEGRTLKIEKGTLDGNNLKLTVKRDRPQGGSMTYVLAGAVEGRDIKGTMEADMDGEKVSRPWTAVRK